MCMLCCAEVACSQSHYTASLNSFSLSDSASVMKTVLVLGGSGYLGQFLVQSLTKSYRVSLLAWLRPAACNLTGIIMMYMRDVSCFCAGRLHAP